MELGVLGPLHLAGAEGALDLRGEKRRGLLAYLVIHHGQVCTVDRIVDALWEGAPSPGATATVRTYVSQLRKLLDDEQRLVTRAGGYVLEIDAGSIDAERFEHLIEQALVEADANARLARLDRALALWRGAPLAEFAGAAWADDCARRWDRLRLVAVERRIQALLELGRHVEALPELERAIAADPLHERLRVQLALATYRSGHQADALAVCRDARRVLVDELGVEPGPELAELERQILDHDPLLRWTSRTEEPVAVAPTPSGLVTFLVTDVERSSHLWEQDASAMARALARHDAIVSAAIEAHGGTIFKQLGDGLLAAFPRPSAAVEAAVRAQIDLVREPWELRSPLRVRMALHAGEAIVERGGDYFGPVLNRCSRLLALANGGQVLASGTVADALRDHRVGGVTLMGLGEHRLRDLLEPERVSQVLHASLPSDFPPLHLLDALPGNLPVQLTSFIGRDDDVGRLVVDVPHRPLTTLLGVGGVGKTRLALQTAAELADQFTDGAWFVDISAIDDAERVPGAITTALGVPQHDGDDATDSLCAYLRHRRAILVIDNCEQVVDGVAAVVSRVNRVCPSVRIVATSRQSLDVAGEHVYAVAPLSLAGRSDTMSAAEMLFVLRARASAPAFEVTDANVRTLRELCERLEGIPLAIELAAARVRALGPEELLARLERRFELLRDSRRDREGRHQTLHAAVDWSYQLLDEAERDLYARLSVFRGGFDVDALLEIARGIDGDALELLDRLVSRSLVTADTSGRSRFRMLETLREHAAERLDESGRRDAIEARHAHHYLDRARTLARTALPGSDDAARLDRDVDNLRAALARQLDREPDTAARVVLALWRYLVMRSMVMEGQQWLEALVERVDPRDLVLRARLLERLGDACLLSGAHVLEGIEWLERALALYESERDDARAARVHTRLARNLSAYPAVMDIEGALAHAVDAGEILATHDDRQVRAEVRAMHASIALYGRRNRDGLAAATEAEEQAERVGDEGLRMHALALRGAHLGYCGEVENGFALLERAWLEADRAGDAFVSFLSAWMRGFGAWLLADPADAIEWWGRERAQPRTAGAPLNYRTLDSMLCLGNLRLGRLGPARAIGEGEIINAPELQPQVALCEGQWDRASRLLTSARELTVKQGNHNEWTQLTLLHARLRMRLGDRAGAARLATDALVTLEPGECPYYEIPARALVAGGGVDADENLDRCHALAAAHDYRGLTGAIALAEARVAVKAGAEASAHEAFVRARDIFTHYRLRFDEVELLIDWGRALAAWGSDDGAARLDEAGRILDEIGTPRWSTLRAGGIA